MYLDNMIYFKYHILKQFDLLINYINLLINYIVMY